MQSSSLKLLMFLGVKCRQLHERLEYSTPKLVGTEENLVCTTSGYLVNRRASVASVDALLPNLTGVGPAVLPRRGKNPGHGGK